MKISKKGMGILSKYRDTDYLNNVSKYILTYDLESVGISIKPNYELQFLRKIIVLLLEEVSNNE